MTTTRSFQNLVQGKLNAAITTTGATSCTVNIDGNFTPPAGLSASNYLMMVIDPEGNEHAPEIMKVTGVSGSSNPYTLTMVRAQESTSAQEWETGRTVVAAVTSGVMDDFLISTTNLTYNHTHERLGIKDANAPAVWTAGANTPDKALHIYTADPAIQLEHTTGNITSVISNASNGELTIEADTATAAGGTAAVMLKVQGTDRLEAHPLGVTITGALAKTSGTFDIAHPLLGGEKRLRHSFVEGPRADLIYRGTIVLDSSEVEVDMDAEGRMTSGTFESLARDPWSLVSCPGGSPVTWSMDGATLTIKGEVGQAAMWIVIAERQDAEYLATEMVDDDGNLITEY
tara:strand:- start:1885 stop:2916 length:1032 start_codon:yes stop_codon:yes gene_type:complete